MSQIRQCPQVEKELLRLSNDSNVYLNVEAVGSFPCATDSSVRMVMITSPSNDELLLNDDYPSLISNESIDQIHLHSLSYLQSKQRRIDHRRNKSEPLNSANLSENNDRSILFECTSISNESAIGLHSSPSMEKTDSSLEKVSSTHPSPSISHKSNRISDKSSIIINTNNNKKRKNWFNVIDQSMKIDAMFIIETFCLAISFDVSTAE
jgi:hypothetical protein